MNSGEDIIVAGIIVLITIYLFFKARIDYRNLTSPSTGRPVSAGERSFYIKGVIFVGLPLIMIRSALESWSSIMIFSLIFILGLWNLLHAFMLMRYNHNKQQQDKQQEQKR